MAAGELEQRRAPVARAAEVGDDDDERALAREPADASERLAERGRSAALEDGLAPEREQQPEQARPALPRRRSRARLAVAERDEAEPVAAARREMAERERDALRDVGLPRSAVPNRIDAETSSTSHVTSTRSASSTRTCGSPVRAVTFHSIRRTSSPGS